MTVARAPRPDKAVAAGAGVSYGHTWVADRDTDACGLVPAGYGDGLPRAREQRRRGAGRRPRRPIRGRVCMDQFVVDLGRRPARRRRRRCVLFGPATHGEPTAQDWADAAGTISYEIVTRIGGRLTRRHVDTEGTTR